MRPHSATFANPQAMAALTRDRKPTGNPDLLVDADRDTWLTPHYILSTLGAFDPDPCAAEQCPFRVAPNSFTKQQDGLQQEWSGRVFMNPPFSDTRPWIAKMVQHRQGIALLPAVFESVTWRKEVWTTAKGILLLMGRPRFCFPDGSTSTGRPLRPVVLAAWDPKEAEMLEASPLAGVFFSSWKIK